ncbi:MAG: 16S rRNA (guanine(527)-N(7))-methyltransferase RsmG [Corynebacterium casei]|uniref:Ribosomal RNA small subunit methyltransferase G n=2 Tax=Corynebacterium casei TaxID=160386 RepID=G7HX48_9CORY|nr:MULTISPECIES: 16S rRNA (guanine(527)-N(7))-methyltransferase RsmG [Corynebacterium]AHI21372.1 16S rRNA methyltransferase GidB [Corynebacterium casei LMG S-19264]MDN5706281.1 16S rRNA (guanine(527)-N(7))-methyltransferase RsmG [Corynebacterium casei]MDN5728959.1 16S rRNA (guanine(527)-N(7))-methyltransferase RsmG [Corynebacterium casei]MDN5740547.1 16S rRNA (guanine(527)-N(7))-methyltransferase RsmG [Corynebacterium casei]MDN5783575.1 16S rRNA (guanine(527)-N(7))-methyltransferase RsmG [Cory
MEPLEVFKDRLPLAEKYHELLATDGSTRGFIGPREVPRLWDRHLINCAVIGDVMEEGATIVDIGSGAGLPGIPLAIARPDLKITLIEPLLKRSVFLQEVVDKLALDNVTVIRGRAEEGPVKKAAAGADIVTSRAVAPLGKLAKWSLPLVRRGGEMIAMKGESVHEELERDAADIKRAGGGKATVEVVRGTTIIRVLRVN